MADTISRPVYMIVAEQQEAQSWWDLGGSTANIEKWAAALNAGGGPSELRILTATHERALTLANAVAKVAKCPPPDERSQLSPVRNAHARDAVPNTPAISFSATFGERVASLLTRLEPIALEIEAAVHPLLIIAPEAQVRALRSFLRPPQSAVLTEREKVDTTVAADQNKLFIFTPKEMGGYEESTQEF